MSASTFLEDQDRAIAQAEKLRTALSALDEFRTLAEQICEEVSATSLSKPLHATRVPSIAAELRRLVEETR